MIKQILRLLFLLAMYELGKYVTEQVYIMMTANDDVGAEWLRLSSGGKWVMWITMTIVFAILLLVCISINSDRAREIQALRYMNDYLLDEVVKTKGYNGLKEYRIELKRMNNDIKK